MRNGNYDEALDLEAFVSKLSTMHPKWVLFFGFQYELILTEFDEKLLRYFCFFFILPWRLPVIQALAAEVRQTTQSLLSQLLQRLRSNIQVTSRIDYVYHVTVMLLAHTWMEILHKLWSLRPYCLQFIGAVARMSAYHRILASNRGVQRVWDALTGETDSFEQHRVLRLRLHLPFAFGLH